METALYRLAHIKAEEAKKPSRNNHLHVTDLSACPVGVWLTKTGQFVDHKDNDSKLRRFDAGKAIEHRVIEAYKHAGILKAEQVELTWPEYNMVGSADAVIEEEGQLWLVEIKSIHTFGIDHLYRENKVHDHYLQQIMLYWSKLKETYPTMKARIYYEALDGRTFEREIDYDSKIVAAGLEKAKNLFSCIATNTRPEPLPTFVKENDKNVLNWRVMYCISSGCHYLCDPNNALSPEPDKWVSKLKYQAIKSNKQ